MSAEKIHHHLREIGITLNKLCILEVVVVVLFCFMAFDLLSWYKMIMTVEKFNAIAFWGAMSGIVASIFTAVRSINQTHKEK